MDLPETNRMEVISRGSFEQQEVLSRPSTTQSTHSLSQLSLEYLPPEAPHFSLNGTSTEIKKDTNTYSHSRHKDTDMHEGNEEAEDLEAEEVLVKEGEGLAEPEGGSIHLIEEEELSDEGKESELLGEEPEETLMKGDLFERVAKLSDDIQQVVSQRVQPNTSTSRAHDVTDNSDENGVQYSPDCASDKSTTASVATPTPSSCSSRPSEKGSEHEQFSDPKVRKAYEKMLKLDERLASLVRREREVKRQRQLLEEEMVRAGAAQPSSVVSLSNQASSTGLVSPVFHTQPVPDSTMSQEMADTEPTLDEGEGEMSSSPTVEESESSEVRRARKRKTRGSEEDLSATDFIKRNIELVTDAGALVMMTKAEKQRLQELLEDETEIIEIVDGEEGALCPVSNSTTTTTPFTLEQKDMERMRELDSQLQAILPTSYWDNLSCPSSSSNQTSVPSLPPSEGLPSSASPSSVGGVGSVGGGGSVGGVGSVPMVLSESSVPVRVEGGDEELAIANKNSEVELFHHLHVSHGERERLRAIDERLHAIQEDKTEDIQNVRLDNEVLQQLLAQCHNEQLDTTQNSSTEQ